MLFINLEKTIGLLPEAYLPFDPLVDGESKTKNKQ